MLTLCFIILVLCCAFSCVGVFSIHQSLFLRSKPAIVSRDDLITMMLTHGFHHPANLVNAGLPGKIAGSFRHRYEARFIGKEELIIDHATVLMWQRSGSSEPFTWRQAKAYVKQLNAQQFGGYADWRLPTIEELASLLEFEKHSGSLYLNSIFTPTQELCWSADILDSAANMWFVYFAHGYISNTDAGSKLYVRAVRSKSV